MRSAIQLYTLREYGDSTTDRVELAGEAGFDAVELAGVPNEEEVGDLSLELAAHDLDVAAAHVDAETLETEPDVVADRLGQLDCGRAVVPYLPEEAFASAAAVDETAHRLTTLSEELSALGVDLSYHNHDHEFQSLRSSDDRANGEGRPVSEAGDGTAFDRLLQETDDHVGVEFDVGWAVAAGSDPVELLERVPERVDLVHFKDTADGVPVQLGEGDVDLDACAEAAREIGAEWAVYEHDDPDDPETDVAEGQEALAALLE
ncbi:sugar phosphate isomerase/epimerase family protein [Halospeciosus flavus]|uniref:Sugar phosphate isomerase/epimerase family protein n=1 Tax=Halospeciosus flavus TaxID=3032283 RepID=A0ABD5Z4G2_9EURY|nr:sugar phosphate isomerase/epimerase [Halospeciosus flavus]